MESIRQKKISGSQLRFQNHTTEVWISRTGAQKETTLNSQTWSRCLGALVCQCRERYVRLPAFFRETFCAIHRNKYSLLLLRQLRGIVMVFAKILSISLRLSLMFGMDHIQSIWIGEERSGLL